MSQKDYPAYRRHLRSQMSRLGRELPGTVAAFGQLHARTMGEGALPAKTKELIALGIAISVRCDGCVAHHVYNSLEAGASRAEIAEVIGVAVMMGGGPSTVYGSEALEALDQYLAEREGGATLDTPA